VVLEETADQSLDRAGQGGVSRGARSDTDHTVSLMVA
jgi:hypothetical protein